jgi:murein DD-endopeptidase MepM/ murein hydrolase activator NlpD
MGVTATSAPRVMPAPPTPVPTRPARPSPTPAAAPLPSPTPTATLPCGADYCVVGELPFREPIAAPGSARYSLTYRFGDTPGAWQRPHYGIDMANPLGVTVVAAADGRVVVAGDDLQTLFGPSLDFYGNLVVLQHDLPAFAAPLFTLYGHLSQVTARVGQTVRRGEPLGAVGMTGVAMGTHLHFEVRSGENTYAAARNPEIFLSAAGDSGSLAGVLTLGAGPRPLAEQVVVERLDAPDGKPLAAFYLHTYRPGTLQQQSPWQDSFGVGSLTPGWYRISFALGGLQTRQVEIFPNHLTVVTFDLTQ